MKIKAKITLIVGKGVEVLPNEIVDVAEAEAKTLISQGFAEELPKSTKKRTTTKIVDEPLQNQGDNENEQPNGNEEGDQEPIQEDGGDGDISKQ